MSVLNKQVSYYPNLLKPSQGITVSLLSILKSNRHKRQIENLRNEACEDQQKRLKKQLPCYTVSGTFKTRCAEGLISLTGLAAVDLDSAENYDPIALMRELKKIPFIAYCGLSCRGKRLFCIVPFATSDYSGHYNRLIRSFSEIGLPMGDSCHKQISQARLISLNSNETQFFNHEAKPYHLLEPIRTISINSTKKFNNLRKFSPPFEIAKQILDKQGISFQKGNRHNYVYSLCFWLNKMGVTQMEAKQYINDHILPLSEIKSNCIDFPYKNYQSEFGTFEFSQDHNP